jgi:hypothetical protein
MTSSYKILFSVDILNDYYREMLCSDFTIIPSAETALFLKKQQLLYKNIGNRLIILSKIKSDNLPAEDGKPFTPIDINSKFVFYLGLNKPEFTSFTNINLDGLNTQRFYFTNLDKNKHQTFSHITAVIDNYNNAKQYVPGDFADDGTKKIFECIKTTTGNNTTDDVFWISRDDVQYVSSKDFITPVNSLLNYVAANASSLFAVNIFELDTATGNYTKLALSQILTFTSLTKNIQLDLSKLKKGKYRITINTEELFSYIDDDFVYAGYFGVIEIFSHLPNGDDFAFLDANGKPAEKEYFIRFANRLATWKYITQKHGVTNVTHPTNKYIFNPVPAPPPNAEYFESNIPVPLKQFPEEFRLQLSPQVSSGPPRAPGPDISVPGVLTKPAPGNDFFCNIYLNY